MLKYEAYFVFLSIKLIYFFYKYKNLFSVDSKIHKIPKNYSRHLIFSNKSQQSNHAWKILFYENLISNLQ